MGKYFNQEEMNSDSEKYQVRRPDFVYGRATRNLAAAIIMSALEGLVWLGLGAGKDLVIICSVIGVIMAIAIVCCLIAAVEQYGWAKDAERDAILDKLDKINSSIERVYNMEYSINMHIHEGMHPEEHKQ